MTKNLYVLVLTMQQAACLLILITNCCFLATATEIRGFTNRFFAKDVTNVSLCNATLQDVEFQTFLFTNGYLYVGATNSILQLSRNLELTNQIIIGPSDDGDGCLSPLHCGSKFCTGDVSCSNNYNTLLLAYRDRLLACGTLYRACDLLMLDDVSVRFGSRRELQCPTEGVTQKVTEVTLRNRSVSVAATVYVNNNQVDNDLFYLGTSDEPIRVFFAPSTQNNYFTIFDDPETYLVERFFQRRAMYHLAWTNEEYAYVLWNDEGSGELKLSRYCSDVFSQAERRAIEEQGTENHAVRTYTEITLQCTVKRRIVTDLISSKFVFDELYLLYRNGRNNTVICSKKLSSLNDEFDEIRSQCWNSTDDTSAIAVPVPQRTNTGAVCRFQNISQEWVTCGYPELLEAFSAAVAAVQPTFMEVRLNLLILDVMATNFAIASSNGLRTSFVGTSSGKVLKAILSSNHSEEATIYAEIISTDQESSILDCLISGDNNDTLVALTKNAIYQASVSNCSQYDTCVQCLGSRDIYCGWCVLEGRCTTRNECPEADTPNLWVPPASHVDRCPRITSPQPSTISTTIATKRIYVSLDGEQLPSQSNYMCRFSVNGSDDGFQLVAFTENGTRNKLSGGHCLYQRNAENIIPTDRDHQNITIEIIYQNNAVANGRFQVFLCAQVKALNRLEMCTACVKSEWGCGWCVETAECTSNTRCTTLISGPNNTSFCPVLSASNVEFPISVGRQQTFMLQTERLPEPFDNYQCRFDFCNKTVTSEATNVNATSSQCSIEANELTCPDDQANFTVSLESRTQDYTVDVASLNLNSSNVNGRIFNCGATSTTCGRCIGFSYDFPDCRWCDANRCEVMCPNNNFASNITACGDGTITSISPLNGPTEGGTILTITGINLGSRVGDISSVMIGNRSCMVLQDQYVASEKIVCETGPANSEESGPVNINTTYSLPIVSMEEYQYRNVNAIAFDPYKVLNRSTITINGTYLDVGSNAYLTLGSETIMKNSSNCTNRTNNLLTCQLPSLPATGSFNLQLFIDKYTKKFSNEVELVAIPTLVNAPTTTNAFAGAGRNITLQLNDSAGVHSVELEIGESIRNCDTMNLPSVTCQIPPRRALFSSSSNSRKRRQTDQSDQTTFSAAIRLNGVHELPIGTISYQPNPNIQSVRLPCDTVDSGNSTDAVHIQGNGFLPDGTFLRSDYSVLLIVENPQIIPHPEIQCNISLVDPNSVFCNVRHETFVQYRYDNIRVNVSFGALGEPVSAAAQCTANLLLTIAIVAAVAVVVFLGGCALGLYLYQRKKRKQQEAQKKIILSKLDDLENKTRETARNAYYELQLGYMNTLAGNVNHRIIYLAPEQYFTQTLFHLSRGHPVLDKTALKNESAVRMEAIRDWTGLLKKREFLLTFIRTLEEQKKFTVQEKGNVASLLTVCLLSDMPYFTNIMFDLLMDLIQKHVAKTPKLLLRRSESVVEKMVSHWLSITLYDECIMEKSGEPIFLLAKAVHYLVTSGPCDVIANKSLNSLNESTLLGSEISYNTKVILASIQEVETEKVSEPVEVSVVDVDTITQVKAKIIEAVYKDRPFSESPKPDDLDFEMLSGETSKEGIVLSDVDHTSVREGNCTKINSVKHYNIPEKARVVLRPVGVLSPVSPAASARSPLIPEGRNQLYHLIHPKDDESSNGHVDLENGGGKRTDAVLEDLIKRPFQEIYLTRMVRAKTTVQEYVDKVFKSILCPEPIPQAVRYFFQFLDREATRHRITDTEVTHIWKTNSLLLRYWVNVLKNPEFIFDIDKTIIVDSCLNVVTQAFMDACTTTNRKLGYDSPSNKLLYARESQQYKKMVKDFFTKVSDTPWIDEADMNETLKKTSQTYAEKFNRDVASQQLYQYLNRYKDQILTALRTDYEDLASEIENIMAKMDDRNNQSETTVV